uniref:Regulator of chromosome condensation n=1 Tax=Macrostomum lignano TaxID=282301 RepID=A0A1I8H4N3_9PLAT
MDASELNFDIPDSGAIFAFGKNVPNRFYVKNDKIVSMDCGEGHAVMVAASGRVFGFGLNDYGQLGLGSKATQAKPAVVKQLKEDGVKAVKVACGPTHTLVLADDGIVYGYGNNSDGQITGDEADFTRPVEVEQLENVEVRDLAAGRAFSLAVSKKGELLAWGGNTEGCLGQEDPDLPGSPDPMPVHLPGRVAAVSAGSYHCACVLTDGRLYAWGETERGKLGIRNAEDQEFLRPRNSTAATKDSQSDNEDEKRLKGSGSRQRGKPSGRLGRDQSPPPSSRAAGRSGGRGGSKPLKPIGHSDEDEENSDKDFGRGRAGRGGRKDGNKDQRRRRQSTKDARAAHCQEDEDDETDEENDRRLTSPSRRRRMSSEGKEPAGRRDSREGDSGVAKGIGCGRGGRSGGDGKTRSCQVL